LAAALEKLPQINDPRVLIGYNTADDAGVVKLNDELALVQTVDFFTPIVDDPYWYGQIAAANSLSDVYAMGAQPIAALNIVGFSKDLFPPELLGEILKGGMDKAAEANTVIVGGHTISDEELKYGLAVTGIIHPDKIMTNAGARPGDVLVLTKPIGTGTITTAIKAGKGSPGMEEKVSRLMAQLNKKAADAALKIGVNACTDITGFGLGGHTLEMARASRVGVVLEYDKIPVIPDALVTVRAGFVPGGTKSNRLYAAPDAIIDDRFGDEEYNIIFDAQTSGGLLLSVMEEKADMLLEELGESGVDAAIIGYVTPEHEGKLVVI